MAHREREPLVVLRLCLREARGTEATAGGLSALRQCAVANLMLVAADSGAASSAALALALFVGIASLGFRGFTAQKGPLEVTPFSAGLLGRINATIRAPRGR